MEPTILSGKTILIVDDFAVNSELLSIFASDVGATALTASNGKECLDIVKKQTVDLILMDSNMPIMNGIDATKAVRALPQGKKIVIVGISGFSSETETNECLQAGMDAIYEKLSFNDSILREIGKRFFDDAESLPQHAMVESICSARHKSEHIFASPAPQAVMDYDKALVEFENDHSLLLTLIADFNKIIHTQFVTIQQAFRSADYPCMQRESHGIKGGAANLCAMPLSTAAKAIETSCRSHAPLETLAPLLNDLSLAIAAFDDFVNQKSQALR